MVDFNRRISEAEEREREHQAREIERRQELRNKLQEFGVGIIDYLREHDKLGWLLAWEKLPHVRVDEIRRSRRDVTYKRVGVGEDLRLVPLRLGYPLFLRENGDWVIARNRTVGWASRDGKASGRVDVVVVEGLFSDRFRLNWDGTMHGGIEEDRQSNDPNSWNLEMTPKGELRIPGVRLTLEAVMIDHLRRFY